MRLLVTRPEPDAQATADRLAALGHAAVLCPLIEIVFAKPVPVAAPAGILFTSRNGVRALARWPDLPAWVEIPAFCGGDATAREARHLGFRAVRSAEGDARDLADLVTAEIKAGDGPLFYPAAAERTGLLEKLLERRGYAITLIEVYRAVAARSLAPDVAAALRGGAIDGVLIHSRRTASILDTLLAASGATLAKRTIIYAMSRAAAAPLLGFGGEIRVAKHPDEDSLLALLPPAA